MMPSSFSAPKASIKPGGKSALWGTRRTGNPIGWIFPAEEIALIYKLRWTIESFFAWSKRHLKVYHLIARSP
ncbi:MAG: transposase [Deltaproteobacteria bacterium]|nr:transposase [Deltaproteobacteria bacterium]